MIEKHRACLRALSDDALDTVAEVTKINGSIFVIDALEARGMVQADVVMALLAARGRGKTPRATAALAELTRLHIVPSPHPWPKPLPPVTPSSVLAVTNMKRNLRLPRPNKEALRVRLGMTQAEIIRTGVTTPVLMDAVTRGWIEWGQTNTPQKSKPPVCPLTEPEIKDIRLWFGWGEVLGYSTSPREYLRSALRNRSVFLGIPRPKRRAMLQFVIKEHARRSNRNTGGSDDHS